jgi:hypothetical protein
MRIEGREDAEIIRLLAAFPGKAALFGASGWPPLL